MVPEQVHDVESRVDISRRLSELDVVRDCGQLGVSSCSTSKPARADCLVRRSPEDLECDTLGKRY